MYCSNCGLEIPEGASFCPNCGQAISAVPVETKLFVAETSDKRGWPFWVAIIAIALFLIWAVIDEMRLGQVLFVLACVFGVYALLLKPRILTHRIQKRLAEGTVIPNCVDYPAISSMLKEAPYSERVIIKNEGLMETESGQQIGFVEAAIKGGLQFRLKLIPNSSETLNLVLESSYLSKWDPSGGFEAAKDYYEADELYRSILHNLFPNYVEQRVQVEREIKAAKIYRYLAIAMIVVFMGYAIITEGLPNWLRNPVEDLQNIAFEDYGAMTLGDAVDSSVENARWNSEKVEDTHYLVTLSGFLPEYIVNFEATFDVNYTDDYVYANISSVGYDGETYTDIFSLAFVLGAIYGN